MANRGQGRVVVEYLEIQRRGIISAFHWGVLCDLGLSVDGDPVVSDSVVSDHLVFK